MQIDISDVTNAFADFSIAVVICEALTVPAA